MNTVCINLKIQLCYKITGSSELIVQVFVDNCNVTLFILTMFHGMELLTKDQNDAV